jgi:hypothetical protein
MGTQQTEYKTLPQVQILAKKKKKENEVEEENLHDSRSSFCNCQKEKLLCVFSYSAAALLSLRLSSSSPPFLVAQQSCFCVYVIAAFFFFVRDSAVGFKLL